MRDFIYNAESWRLDCADLITGSDEKRIEELRGLCANALGWKDLIGKATVSDSYGEYAAACARIGSHIVGNLVNQGYTAERLEGK